jgi:AAA15 family ATPase/GTPase
MLTRLHLKNFRGFEDHELTFEKFTLIVGRNNAGKSTIIEALRLVALCTMRYRTLGYTDAPREFRVSGDSRGIAPSMRDIEFNVDNLFYRYGRPPSVITASFSVSES